MINIRKYFLENITDKEYHFIFKNYIHIGVNFFLNNAYEFWDDKAIIERFKELCEPKKEYRFSEYERILFYLITYYLYKEGYVIKEFPMLFERPPRDMNKFVVEKIKNKIRVLENKKPEDIVRWQERRDFVESMQIIKCKKEINIEIETETKELLQKLSTREFEKKNNDEKLVAISEGIEHILKENKKYLELDFEKFEIIGINNENIKNFRKIIHCFRHATNESLIERKNFSEKEKEIFINFGLVIINAIHYIKHKNNEKNEN